MSDVDREPFDRLVADTAAEQHCPTVSWGIVAGGRLELTGSVGDVSAGTVYRIASMTKSFSAAATLALRDDGQLRLDDPIGVHAPELTSFRSPTADAPPITIRDLLAMTSGLVTDDPWADRHLDLPAADFDAVVADGGVFARPTGTSYEYSNFGFALLGRVVERATGRTVQDHVSERLLAPLQLGRTTWVQPDHEDWTRPMRWLDDGFVDELPPLGDGMIAPMGGLWTTVADLARWVSWLDDAFPARDADDAGPLSRASRREMQSPQSYVGLRTLRGVRHPTSYGYGLRIMHEQDLGTVIAHSGGIPGYGSSMRWVSGSGVGAIALANSTYAPMTELAARLLDEAARQGLLTRRPADVAPPLAAAARQLVEQLNAWTDERADQLFADNVAADDSYERRRAEAAAHTPLTIVNVEAVNDARGTIVCTSSSGDRVRISLSLAPHRADRIQAYTIDHTARGGS